MVDQLKHVVSSIVAYKYVYKTSIIISMEIRCPKDDAISLLNAILVSKKKHYI